MKGRNIVIDLALLIIKLVFLSVNNNHAMANGRCKLVIGGANQGHISDEVRDYSHLSLGSMLCHDPILLAILVIMLVSVGINPYFIGTILIFSLKVFKTF